MGEMFRNFDEFNASFKPFRDDLMQELFFKLDKPPLNGRYMFEFVQRACIKAAHRNILLEPRFTIFGRDWSDWSVLASWARRWDLFSKCGGVLLFAVQLPRIFPVWVKSGHLTCFGDMLRNFFGPLFEAVANPEANADVAWLLERLRMVDTVDDESKLDAYWDDQPAHRLPT